MPDLDHAFQRLCHEAVVACGADVAAVERYVMARIDGMDETGRARIKRDLKLVLDFRPPDARSTEPH